MNPTEKELEAGKQFRLEKALIVYFAQKDVSALVLTGTKQIIKVKQDTLADKKFTAYLSSHLEELTGSVSSLATLLDSREGTIANICTMDRRYAVLQEWDDAQIAEQIKQGDFFLVTEALYNKYLDSSAYKLAETLEEQLSVEYEEMERKISWYNRSLVQEVSCNLACLILQMLLITTNPSPVLYCISFTLIFIHISLLSNAVLTFFRRDRRITILRKHQSNLRDSVGIVLPSELKGMLT